MSVEGMPVVTATKTEKGEYLTIVDYLVVVQDNTLSIKLGESGKGLTLLNYLMINSSPKLSQTEQILRQNFGVFLPAGVLSSGTVAKINPNELLNDKKKLAKLELQRQRELAKLELQRPKVLAKLEGMRQKELAKLDKWETKQEEKIAKIDQKISEFS